MFTGYLSVSSILVLWLMLGYFYFSYLIRIVMFFNRYRSLDCCTVLSCKVFLQFLLLWRILVPHPLFFHSLWSDFFYNVDVCTFSWVFTLFDICSILWRERERKPTRCNNQMFIINTVSTCFGHCYAHLHSARTPQRSAPQLLPTSSSRTSAAHRMQ